MSSNMSSSSRRHFSVKKSSHETKISRLKNQIAKIQEEREEVVNLINIHVDRDILTAEEVLLLGKEDLEKLFDEVNSHLENCIEKLLLIRVSLLSGEKEDPETKTPGSSGSECNHMILLSNYLGKNLNENNDEENDERNNEEKKFVGKRIEEKEIGIDGVHSRHAIQGYSSVRSSPFLEPSFSFSSSTNSHSLCRHQSNDEGGKIGEEGRRQVFEQTNHGDHYNLEGLKQKEEKRNNLSIDTNSPSYISQSVDSESNLSPLQSKKYSQARKSSSNKSFDEHELVINSGSESDDVPSSYPIVQRKQSITLKAVEKPPIPSGTISATVDPQQGENEDNKKTRDVYSQLMMKSYSNEEIVFRMADERAHQQLGHVPQEHNWTDYTARLSLPSLEPPENFRNSASTHELAPQPVAQIIHRTPELVNITTKSSECDEEFDVMNDSELICNIVRPRMLKQDSSETKTTTTSSCDRFDTASSEIYFSQDGTSPNDQSLSNSPPLFIATPNKPPLASPSPPATSSAPSYRKRTSYPKINIPIGINLSIRISHVNDPSDFWIHVNRDQVNMLFNEVQLLQEKFVQSNHVSVRTPIIGSMYATRYSSDVSWYRVEIIEILINNYVKILFIDYGFTAKVSSLELSILNPLLQDKAAQAFNCSLKGVQAPSGQWTPNAVDEFKNSVSFYSVRAIFYDPASLNEVNRIRYPVDLFLDWGSGEMNNVLLYLSPTEFITNESLNMPKEQSSTAEGKEKEKKSSNSNNSSMMMKTGDLRAEILKERKRKNFTPIFIEPPSIPEKEYILGVISHVVSPSEFYIHIMPEEDCDGSSQLDDLREQLNEYYNNSSNSDLTSGNIIFPSNLNSLKDSCWCAMFPTDNSWYRVRIIEILEDEEEEGEDSDDEERGNIIHALVQYIDYGNIEVVTLDELRALSTDIASVPALAVKCHLAYIKPDGNKWSEDALSFFEQLSGFEQETLVTAHLVYKPNRIDFKTSLSVLLWNNNANNNIDFETDISTEAHDVLINALMVNESLAITDSIEWMEEVEKIHTDQEVSQKVSFVQEVTKRILGENTEPNVGGEEGEEEEEEEIEIVEQEEENEPFEVPSYDLCQLALDSIVLLKISHVESPYEFYGILPCGSSTLDETECESIQELMAKIETAPVIAQKKLMCDNLIQFLKSKDLSYDPSLDSHQINQVALIKHADDAFRGRILRYAIETDSYDVQDIDSGVLRSISSKEIRHLPSEFLSIPAFAVKCKLANIEPISGYTWSKDVIETFKQDTEGCSFAAHVISRDNDILLVELVGLDEDNTVSVCEYLVSLGFGRELSTPEPGEKLLTTDMPITSSKPPIPNVRKRRGSNDSQDSKVQIFVTETENV